MSSKPVQGTIRKLKGTILSTANQNHIQYSLPMDEQIIPLNSHIGKKIKINFSGAITCEHCQIKIKKSYAQGYCFPCSQKLARNDFCILKPELCHHHLGTCREPDWGTKHCMVSHIVYIANTSGPKVGITRVTEIPTRWIDQGATQALPILKVKSRLESGKIEVILKDQMADKTNWRKMLQGDHDWLDLVGMKNEILNSSTELSQHFIHAEQLENANSIELKYPVLQYPKKITSLKLDNQSEIVGTLMGIKGQYLILDVGVINIRNHTGYHIGVTFDE